MGLQTHFAPRSFVITTRPQTCCCPNHLFCLSLCLSQLTPFFNCSLQQILSLSFSLSLSLSLCICFYLCICPSLLTSVFSPSISLFRRSLIRFWLLRLISRRRLTLSSSLSAPLLVPVASSVAAAWLRLRPALC